MLRPLLVVLGARGVGGASLDYPHLPDAPGLGVGLELTNQSQKLLSTLRSTRDDERASPELEAWKAESPFPGGLPNRIYLLAGALEILHLASLVHDDVVDGSPLRRGQPAAWKVLGSRHAVLLGDLLLSLCFALVSHGSRVVTGQILSGMVRLMVRSEFQQALDREHFDGVLVQPSRRIYNRVITGKTAMLFSLSLSVGAREMAGETGSSIQSFRRGGYFLGVAFQVQDDILDYLGSRQRFGKPPGQDLRDGQVTLPLIEALVPRNPEDPGVKERQRSLIQHIGQFRQGNEEVLDTIIHDIRGLGGFSAADTRSRNYLEKARREFQKACRECKAPGVLERLDLLLGFLENRHY